MKRCYFMWFFFALATIFLWGGADLFYKIGSDSEDRFSHWWIVVSVGFLMGIHACGFILISDVRFEWVNMLRYLPASICYILSMTLGYVGLRYIELSVSSPISNSSGAVAFLLGLVFLGDSLSVLQFVAVAAISIGIFLLSFLENNKRNSSFTVIPGNEKYQIGIIATIFPILYCVIDGLGTFADAFILDRVMDEEQALLAYEFTFLLVALVALFYLLFIKKQPIRFPKQLPRILAGVFETAGQFFYVYALAAEVVLVPPMIASYSIVSVLLSRIFLKEKLTKWQYAVIMVILAGIAVLGID